MGVRKEHQEQVKVVQYVRTFYPEVLLCSIPNGAGTTAKNRLSLYFEGLLAGMPDLFLAEPQKGFNGLFLEMKTETGRESQEQKLLRDKLTKNGYLCLVARNHQDAIKFIEDYMDKDPMN